MNTNKLLLDDKHKKKKEYCLHIGYPIHSKWKVDILVNSSSYFLTKSFTVVIDKNLSQIYFIHQTICIIWTHTNRSWTTNTKKWVLPSHWPHHPFKMKTGHPRQQFWLLPHKVRHCCHREQFTPNLFHTSTYMHSMNTHKPFLEHKHTQNGYCLHIGHTIHSKWKFNIPDNSSSYFLTKSSTVVIDNNLPQISIIHKPICILWTLTNRYWTTNTQKMVIAFPLATPCIQNENWTSQTTFMVTSSQS